MILFMLNFTPLRSGIKLLPTNIQIMDLCTYCGKVHIIIICLLHALSAVIGSGIMITHACAHTHYNARTPVRHNITLIYAAISFIAWF